MSDHNEEKKQLSRRDVLILGGGSLAGLVLGGCAPAPAATPTEAPAAEPAVEPTQAPAAAPPAAEPVVEVPANLNTVPVAYVGRDLDKCSGCRLCEVACSQFHEDGKIWPAASRVRVHEFYPGIEFPVLCYQCGNAPCVDACPEGAISVNPETSTVVFDETKCLRTTEGSDCTECFTGCPGGAITFHPETRIPISCDLCDGDPQCVQACREKVLTVNGIRLGAGAPEEFAKSMRNAYIVPGFSDLKGTDESFG